MRLRVRQVMAQTRAQFFVATHAVKAASELRALNNSVTGHSSGKLI